jgi:hypothetical protein
LRRKFVFSEQASDGGFRVFFLTQEEAPGIDPFGQDGLEDVYAFHLDLHLVVQRPGVSVMCDCGGERHLYLSGGDSIAVCSFERGADRGSGTLRELGCIFLGSPFFESVGLLLLSQREDPSS